jgi:Flp pilus assembly pilin Flp
MQFALAAALLLVWLFLRDEAGSSRLEMALVAAIAVFIAILALLAARRGELAH